MEKKVVVGEERKEIPDHLVFRVYVPTDKRELINKYISYAKLHFDNQVWKVMEAGMDHLIESEKLLKIYLMNKVDELEDRISKLENNKNKKKVTTFAGKVE